MGVDPYSYVAHLALAGQMDGIRAFWANFADHADALDATFNSQMSDMKADPAEVMAPLRDISKDLMWEFGPTDTGHSLCITAEWKHEHRALARAMMEAAPNLPRWTFNDAREGLNPVSFADNFAARYGTTCVLHSITPERGPNGKIDMRVRGDGDQETVGNQTLMAASMILGEKIDREWFGMVDVVAKKRTGLLGRFRSETVVTFDPVAFKQAFTDEISAARNALPRQRLSQIGLDDRQLSLMEIEPDPDRALRPDLITFVTMSVEYAQAAIEPMHFASTNHSAMNEWFLMLRIGHQGQGNAEERADIEETIHRLLSQSQLGGVMAGGYGFEAYYIDVGTTDVAAALSLLSERLAHMPWAPEATMHLLEAGLEQYTLPLADTALRHQ